MQAYLFDLDGTLCDISHRLHHIQNGQKNWDAFFAACDGDLMIPHMVTLAKQLCRGDEAAVVFVSGRSDAVRDKTGAWLRSALFPDAPSVLPLYMRKAGDHRPDHIVKGELLDQILADGFKPIMAFEDRDQVVKMWRSRGIPCAQVAEGGF